MPIRTPDGYLDITNATLRGSEIITTSNVGIANSAPTHTLSVGNKLFVDDSAANVLTVSGNLVATSLKIGQIDLAPSYGLEHVSNVGNTISNVVQFTNTGTGFVSASNVGIGTTTTPAGLLDVVGTFRMRYQDMGVTKAHIITGANSTSLTESGGTYTYTRGGSGNTGNFLPNPSNIVPKVGQRYRVKLTARSDYAGTIRYECPTSTIITTYDLTASFKEYTWDFTATGATMQFAVTTASGTTSQFNAFSIERLGVGFNVNPTSTNAPVQISGVTHFSDWVGIGTASPRWGFEVTPMGGLGGVLSCSNDPIFSHNLYYSGGWKYGTASTGGAYIRMIDSQVQFWNAPNSGSGTWDTAGGAATTTQRMTINEFGLVGIGSASPAAILDVFNSDHNTGYRETTQFRISNASNHASFTRMIFGQLSTNNGFIDVTNQANTKGNLILQPWTGNVGIGMNTTTPITKLNMKNGVFLAENQTSTNTQILYGDGGGAGNNNNSYTIASAKFGVGVFVNDTGTTGSTITLVNKEGANNITKHASIGFVTTDTTDNGKFGGQIGFWPEDANASKMQFRIYTSGAQAGYNLPVQRMVVNGNAGYVGIGTASPRGMLDVYTANTAIPGLIIDRAPSGTYRSELYQEQDGLSIKVGDGTNAPAENMRITRTTTATPGRLTVGSSTANSSNFYVHAGGNSSSTVDTDLHVQPNGRVIAYGTRPWITTSNGQGTLGRTCSLTMITSDHMPALEWVRNTGQGTNQRNWLLRQENDDQVNFWEYNGSAWTVPVAFHKDYLLTGVTHDLAFHYGRALKVSPQNVSLWPSGTTNLITVAYSNNQDTINFYTPGGGRSTPLMTLKHLGRVGIDASTGFTSGPEPRAKFHIGEYIPNNTGTNNTFPSSNMGHSAWFPTSTKIWMANRATAGEEDYWGCAMGVIWDGHTYIQSINKKSSAYYDILLNPNGGDVGVGTNNSHAKFTVWGHGGSMTSANRTMMYWSDGSTITAGVASMGTVGIYASDDIVSYQYIMSHQGTMTSSDERIKKNIVDADDAECLETLRLLKPKKYEYKDTIRGKEPVWGFIAQEVKDVLPYATGLRKDVLPNIHELANVSSSNVITFTNFNTDDLESNATTLIRTIGADGTEHDIHLEEVIDGHTIRVKEDLSDWTGSVDETGNVVAGNQIFVFGQEVDDFVFLKKESIFTVATAALQEVDRQVQAEKSKTTALETKTTTLDTELQEAEAKTTALETKLQEAEAKITTLQAEKEALRSDLSSLVLRVAALES